MRHFACFWLCVAVACGLYRVMLCCVVLCCVVLCRIDKHGDDRCDCVWLIVEGAMAT